MAKPRGYKTWTPAHKSTYWANRRKVKANLLDPNKQLAGQPLLDVAKAQVGLELDPQVSALDTQARSTRIQQGALASRAGGYYKDLADSVAGDVARSKALTGSLSGRIGQIGAEGQATLDRAQGVADTTRDNDVGIRGEGLQGGGDERVRAELAAQRAGMASSTQAAQNTAANIGGGVEGLLSEMGATQKLRGGEVQQQLLNRMQNELGDVRAKKTEVQAKRGPAVLDQLTKLRQTAFENAMTARTLGQKEQADALDYQVKLADLALQGKKARQVARSNADKLALSYAGLDVQRRGQDKTAGSQRRGQDVTLRGYRETARHNRALEIAAKMKASGKAGGKIVDKTRNALEIIGNVQATYEGAGGRGMSGSEMKKVANALRKERKGMSPKLLNIGSRLATKGNLSAADIRWLKTYYPDMPIPGGWRPKRKKKLIGQGSPVPRYP